MDYRNPYLAYWLFLVAAGSMVFIVNPQWARRRLWGAVRAPAQEPEARRPQRVGIDVVGGSAQVRRSSIRNQDVALRARDATIDATDNEIE